MRKPHSPAKKCIELLPAILLPLKGERQAIFRDLPAGTCLVILPDHNPKIEGQMRAIAQVFEYRSRRVEVLREADLDRVRA